MAIRFPALFQTLRPGLGILALATLTACSTTSGSTRIDETGENIANATSTEPESSAYYIQALHGGLVSRIPGVRLSGPDRSRALEAVYKVLESAPGGQSVVWEGTGGLKGEVVAAAPYQVGSQNCRQYSHSIAVRDGVAPAIARGAACRNANGSWTPL